MKPGRISTALTRSTQQLLHGGEHWVALRSGWKLRRRPAVAGTIIAA
jgi:hypothetical protein